MKKQSYKTSFLITAASLILLLAVFSITVFAQGKQAPAASEEGKVLYDDKCAHCHGIEGAGRWIRSGKPVAETEGFHTRTLQNPFDGKRSTSHRSRSL